MGFLFRSSYLTYFCNFLFLKNSSKSCLKIFNFDSSNSVNYFSASERFTKVFSQYRKTRIISAMFLVANMEKGKALVAFWFSVR